jgi:hypothetical protein
VSKSTPGTIAPDMHYIEERVGPRVGLSMMEKKTLLLEMKSQSYSPKLSRLI